LLAHRDAILARNVAAGSGEIPAAATSGLISGLISPRAYIKGLTQYHSPQVKASARLNSNESPLPPPESFRQAVSEAVAGLAWQRYPKKDGQPLREAIAASHGLDSSQIFAANGSNEVIQTILMCYAAAGRTVLVFEPSYIMHSHIAQTLGCSLVVGQRRQDFKLPLPQVEQLIMSKRPSVVFLCSPNNPTGMAEPFEVISKVLELAKAAGALLVVDEAYVEFSPHSALELFSEDAPLVLTRTFSKTWAMAAARLGYAITPSWVNSELGKVALPYRVNEVTQIVGELALDYEAEMKSRVQNIKTERGRILEGLDRLGVKFWPSDANFVLFQADTADAMGASSSGTTLSAGQTPAANPIWNGLLERSVLVRDCSAWPRLQNCLRVTVGTAEENNLFLEALEDVLKQ